MMGVALALSFSTEEEESLASSLVKLPLLTFTDFLEYGTAISECDSDLYLGIFVAWVGKMGFQSFMEAHLLKSFLSCPFWYSYQKDLVLSEGVRWLADMLPFPLQPENHMLEYYPIQFFP